MISSNQLRGDIKFLLDAEGVDHYGDAEDIIPAINMAVRFVVSVINSALGQKKLTEEIFESIHKAKVFRTSQDSRISTSIFIDEIWTITAVMPEPETGLTGLSVPSMPNDKSSYLRADLYHIGSKYSAERLSLEKWSEADRNPFSNGFDRKCEDTRSYAYMGPITYNPDGSVLIPSEIEVKPKVKKNLVTVFYVAKPSQIAVLGNDDITLPEQVYDMLVNKALNYIAYQQGDRTNLFQVTQSDIVQLVNTVV
jgi:hypothetical protein